MIAGFLPGTRPVAKPGGQAGDGPLHHGGEHVVGAVEMGSGGGGARPLATAGWAVAAPGDHRVHSPLAMSRAARVESSWVAVGLKFMGNSGRPA